MDFQQLLAKMQQLDQPVPEQTTNEMGCGDAPPMPSMPPKADEPPPSMSINLNAQGLDNIEELMKLIKAVNPEMDKPSMPPLPSMSSEPSIMSIKPSMPPLKMLPDMDADNDVKIGGEMDSDKDSGMDKATDKKDKDEAFGNSVGDSEPEYRDMDAAVPDGDDLNKPKKSFSDKPYRGDNPMAAESTDLRAQIRAELQRRLEEAKK